MKITETLRGLGASALPDSVAELGSRLLAALTAFTAEKRLYALEVEGHGDADWLVEAFAATESLNGLAQRELVLLSTDVQLDLEALPGLRATQLTSLADGNRAAFPGLVAAAELLGSDGGFARYKLTLVQWPWLLQQQTHNRVWQEKTLLQIVEAVFADAAYTPYAHWRFADDLAPFLAELPPRDYCVQYAETDWQFLSRLLAEEGLGLSVQPEPEAPAGHSLLLFADASLLPLDASAAANGGSLRYHRASSQEASDALQSLSASSSVSASLLTVLGYIDSGKRAVAAESLTATQGERIPALDHYQPQLPRPLQTQALAARATKLWAQSVEAHTRRFEATSTIRSLRPGTRLGISGLPLAAGRLSLEDPAFTVITVASAGLNNLPAQAQSAAFALFGSALPALGSLHPQLSAERLQATGYANHAQLLPAELPWRPRWLDDQGQPLHVRPRASGCQTALVTGPKGQIRPSGADELHCDAQGRVRVKFHWQQAANEDSSASDTAWLRVAQRQAGAGYGSHFLPRIGQEVLVGFLGGDPDQPIVLGALYNGRGETKGQGNETGGNAPAWHGAAPGVEAMRNAAAYTGFKSKEFGGLGSSQLLLDDTTKQLRLHYSSSQAMSQLSLGHLVSYSDNHRQHHTGAGFALSTQAYSAVRAQSGLLLSSYAAKATQAAGLPAGDFAAGQALLKQVEQLGQAMSQAAGTHQTLKLASVEGSSKAGSSQLDAKAAPIKASHAMSQGMVAGSAQKPEQKVPHFSAPALALHAKSDMAHIAGQHLHQTANETLTQVSGLDTHLGIGGQLRLHTGQGIGILAGVTESKGSGKDTVNAKGISLIAAGPITAQAQADALTLAAKQNLKVVSANANLDFVAAKSITLKTAAGASLTLEGGKITVACPGTITVKAAKKEMTGGDSKNYELPKFSKSEIGACKNCILDAMKKGAAGTVV